MDIGHKFFQRYERIVDLSDLRLSAGSVYPTIKSESTAGGGHNFTYLGDAYFAGLSGDGVFLAIERYEGRDSIRRYISHSGVVIDSVAHVIVRSKAARNRDQEDEILRMLKNRGLESKILRVIEVKDKKK